jgi:hypothetical protein
MQYIALTKHNLSKKQEDENLSVIFSIYFTKKLHLPSNLKFNK